MLNNIVHKSAQSSKSIDYGRSQLALKMADFNAAFAIRVTAEFYSNLDDEHWVCGNSIEALCNHVNVWCEENCFEHFHFVGGDIVDAKGRILGIYRPSSERIMDVGDTGNDCYERLPTSSSILLETACNTPPENWFIKN